MCWLVLPDTQTQHLIASCHATNINLGAVIAFQQRLHWEASCHYWCGAPLFVCQSFSNLQCGYNDILLPFLLAAFRSSTYSPMIARIIGYRVNEKEFKKWIVEPNCLFEKEVTNALVAFEAVYR